MAQRKRSDVRAEHTDMDTPRAFSDIHPLNEDQHPQTKRAVALVLDNPALAEYAVERILFWRAKPAQIHNDKWQTLAGDEIRERAIELAGAEESPALTPHLLRHKVYWSYVAAAVATTHAALAT